MSVEVTLVTVPPVLLEDIVNAELLLLVSVIPPAALTVTLLSPVEPVSYTHLRAHET